jgi:hypothetical protein
MGERITKKHIGLRVRVAELGVPGHCLELDIIDVSGMTVRALFEMRECRVCPAVWRIAEVLP